MKKPNLPTRGRDYGLQTARNAGGKAYGMKPVKKGKRRSNLVDDSSSQKRKKKGGKR